MTANSFYRMSVRIKYESSVIVFTIHWSKSRFPFAFSDRNKRRCVERIDSRSRICRKRYVHSTDLKVNHGEVDVIEHQFVSLFRENLNACAAPGVGRRGGHLSRCQLSK